MVATRKYDPFGHESSGSARPPRHIGATALRTEMGAHAGHELYKAAGLLMEDRAVRHAIASAQWPEDADKPDIGSHLGNISTTSSPLTRMVTFFDAQRWSEWVTGLGTPFDPRTSGVGQRLRWRAALQPGCCRPRTATLRQQHRLLLFLTRPDFTPHQVMPVRRPASAEPRFGATGWYMTRGDRFSAAVQRENDAMRAAASKASSRNGDVCI